MSVSRIIIFIVGAALTIYGAYWMIQSFPNIVNVLMGIVLLVVGVLLLTGKLITL